MNRIVFFMGGGDNFTNPTLNSIFKILLQKNIELNIFASKQTMSAPDSLEGIKIIPISEYHGLGYTRLPRRPYYIYHTIRSFHRINKFLGNNPGQIIIGIDPPGLIMAHQVSKLLNKPKLGYFSFEIFFWDELQTRDHYRLKRREVKASRELNFCLIQDPLREDLLRKENKFNSKCHFFHIPVSPIKDNEIINQIAMSQDQLKIILPGAVTDRNGYDHMLGIMESNWNNKYYVEFHSPRKVESSNTYVQRIKYLQSKGLPVYFHDEPFVNARDYWDYLCQFDVGLSLYIPNDGRTLHGGRNVKYMGLSSGRFSTYMMLGIPTITTENEILKQLNVEYPFGKVIKNIKQDLPTALEDIIENYEEYHSGALKLYDEKLNPKPDINDMLEFIFGE